MPSPHIEEIIAAFKLLGEFLDAHPEITEQIVARVVDEYYREQRAAERVAEYDALIASLLAAGLQIDVETCQYMYNESKQVSDPYGVGHWFVASPDDGEWISTIYLPEDKSKALHARIEREAIERENALIPLTIGSRGRP